MRSYLFAGPTLPDAAELTRAHDVEVRPPIAAGDLFRLSPSRGDRVGIIDGYFHQQRSIPHKEILNFLKDGVQVLGAASMGALRAAELHRFGMRGIGAIYDDFVHGRIDADDEVAVLHGPQESGYRAMSEALVNIRATLQEAERIGLLTAAQRKWLIDQQAGIHYPERSLRRVLAAAGELLPDDALDALADFCKRETINRKRLDALALIEELLAERTEDPLPPGPIARTLFLYSWQLATATAGPGEPTDLAALRALQILAPDYPARYRLLVLNWLAARCHAGCGTSQVTPAEKAAVQHGVHAGRYALPRDEQDLDCFGGWLSPREQGLAWQERAVRYLVRSFRIAPGVVYDELPLHAFSHALPTGRKMASLADQVNAKASEINAAFDVSALNAAKIRALLAARWGCPADDLEFAAMDRGFDSLADAVAGARHLYFLAEHNPDRVAIVVGEREGGRDAQPAALEG